MFAPEDEDSADRGVEPTLNLIDDPLAGGVELQSAEDEHKPDESPRIPSGGRGNGGPRKSVPPSADDLAKSQVPDASAGLPGDNYTYAHATMTCVHPNVTPEPA